MARSSDRTPLQETERQAMAGDEQAVLRLVHAIRELRKLVEVFRVEYDYKGWLFTGHASKYREIEADGDETW